MGDGEEVNRVVSMRRGGGKNINIIDKRKCNNTIYRGAGS